MVKVLVTNYSDIFAEDEVSDGSFTLRTEVRFFDTALGLKNELLTVDINLNEADTVKQTEDKIFDTIVDNVKAYGCNISKSDILMMQFKRGI
jgi:hypothetical protein